MRIEYNNEKTYTRNITNQIGTDDIFLKEFPDETPVRDGFVNYFNNTNTIFVDVANGNDTTGNGNWATPYKTVKKGISMTVSGRYHVLVFNSVEPGVGNIEINEGVLDNTGSNTYCRISAGLVDVSGNVNAGEWGTINYSANLNNTSFTTAGTAWSGSPWILATRDFSYTTSYQKVLYTLYFNGTNTAGDIYKLNLTTLYDQVSFTEAPKDMIEFNNKIYVACVKNGGVGSLYESSNNAVTTFTQIWNVEQCVGLFELQSTLFIITQQGSGGGIFYKSGATSFTQLSGTPYQQTAYTWSGQIIIDDADLNAYFILNGKKYRFNGTVATEILTEFNRSYEYFFKYEGIIYFCSGNKMYKIINDAAIFYLDLPNIINQFDKPIKYLNDWNKTPLIGINSKTYRFDGSSVKYAGNFILGNAIPYYGWLYESTSTRWTLSMVAEDVHLYGFYINGNNEASHCKTISHYSVINDFKEFSFIGSIYESNESRFNIIKDCSGGIFNMVNGYNIDTVYINVNNCILIKDVNSFYNITENVFFNCGKCIEIDNTDGYFNTGDPITIKNNIFYQNSYDIINPEFYIYTLTIINNIINGELVNCGTIDDTNLQDINPLFCDINQNVFTLFNKDAGYPVDSLAVKAGATGYDMGAWDVRYTLLTNTWKEYEFIGVNIGISPGFIPINQSEILNHLGDLKTGLDTTRKKISLTFGGLNNTRDFLTSELLLKDTGVKRLYLSAIDDTDLTAVIQKSSVACTFDTDKNITCVISSYFLKNGIMDSGYIRVSISSVWYYFKIKEQTADESANTTTIIGENIFNYTGVSNGSYNIEFKNCQFWGNVQLDISDSAKLNYDTLTMKFVKDQWRNYLFRLIDGTGNDKLFRINENGENHLIFEDVYETAFSWAISTDYSIMIECLLSRLNLDNITGKRSITASNGLKNGSELYVSENTIKSDNLMKNWSSFTLNFNEVSDYE